MILYDLLRSFQTAYVINEEHEIIISLKLRPRRTPFPILEVKGFGGLDTTWGTVNFKLVV